MVCGLLSWISMGQGPAWLPVATGAFVICVTFGLLGTMSPRAVTVEDGAVVVRYLLWKRRIELAGVTEVSEVPYAVWSRGLIRLFGVGFPLPPAGRYRNKAFGAVTIYSTRRKGSLTLLRVETKRVLVSLSEAERGMVEGHLGGRPRLV